MTIENKLLQGLSDNTNITTTENGAIVRETTDSDLLDLFGKIGAMRSHHDNPIEITNSFDKAFIEDPLLALKMLFYIRDIRGGQGERETFRIILKHLSNQHSEIIEKNMQSIPEYGRWDDLLVLLDTPLKKEVSGFIKSKLMEDLVSEQPSLLAKWLPSENSGTNSQKKIKRLKRKLEETSGDKNKRQLLSKIEELSRNPITSKSNQQAKVLIKEMNMTPKQYRKILSTLRKELDLIETKLTEKRYEDIEYDKIPSYAGLKYRESFFRNDEERYESFLDNLSKGEVTVNSSTLYPYELVSKVLTSLYKEPNESNVILYNGMWDNLPNYLEGSDESALAVIDVSGSMSGTPMDVAISLGLYMSEKNQGPFQDHFITFSERPKLQVIEGDTFSQRVRSIRTADWGMNTNLEKVFDLILDTAIEKKLKQEDLPDKLFIISDMEFDEAVGNYCWGSYDDNTEDSNKYTEKNKTLMETIKHKYENQGYAMPKLIFWNVDARNTHVPMKISDSGFQLISGFSPSIFEHTMKGEFLEAYDLMLKVIESERYSPIRI